MNAVENAFGSEIDYSMLVKVYGKGTQEDERRYSPAVCTGAELVHVAGEPEVKHISTSFVERQHLTAYGDETIYQIEQRFQQED